MSKSVKKLILLNLPYLFFFWLFSKVGEAYQLAFGQNVAFKIIATYASLKESPLRLHPDSVRKYGENGFGYKCSRSFNYAS